MQPAEQNDPLAALLSNHHTVDISNTTNQTTTTSSSNNSSRLPPELISYIAQECIEPYDAIIDLSHKSAHGKDIVYQIYPTSRPVKSNLNHYSLISPSFRTGIRQGLQLKFSGRLNMANLLLFYVSLDRVWREIEADQLNPPWLIALVTMLSVKIPVVGSFERFPIQKFGMLKVVQLHFKAPSQSQDVEKLVSLVQYFARTYSVNWEVFGGRKQEMVSEEGEGAGKKRDDVKFVCILSTLSDGCAFEVDMLESAPKVTRTVRAGRF